MTNLSRCPLCGSRKATRFFETRDKHGHREFEHCPECDMVFVPRRHHLDSAAQRERYLTHENDTDDEGYRNFLSRLLDALRPHLLPGASGLDYGAGTGPALAVMMREEGFGVQLYDPFFHPDESVLEQTYDFITCTETAEHFADPMQDLQALHRMLRPAGWLGVMTGMLDSWEGFPGWYYQRDPTHICFYSKTTMEWIADQLSLEVHFPRENVALFHKPA
jgi:SAM-dependent methyltransferase